MVFQKVFHKIGWLEKTLGKSDRFRTSGNTFWSRSTGPRFGLVLYLGLVGRLGQAWRFFVINVKDIDPTLEHDCFLNGFIDMFKYRMNHDFTKPLFL